MAGNTASLLFIGFQDRHDAGGDKLHYAVYQPADRASSGPLLNEGL